LIIESNYSLITSKKLLQLKIIHENSNNKEISSFRTLYKSPARTTLPQIKRHKLLTTTPDYTIDHPPKLAK
jgi:hypothetical protein